MARKKLVKFTRHYLAKNDTRLFVAVDPERVTKVTESESYTTLQFSTAKDCVHVTESFADVLDAINAPRV